MNASLHGRTNVQTGYMHYLRPSKAVDDAAEMLQSTFSLQGRRGA